MQFLMVLEGLEAVFQLKHKPDQYSKMISIKNLSHYLAFEYQVQS